MTEEEEKQFLLINEFIESTLKGRLETPMQGLDIAEERLVRGPDGLPAFVADLGEIQNYLFLVAGMAEHKELTPATIRAAKIALIHDFLFNIFGVHLLSDEDAIAIASHETEIRKEEGRLH